MTTGNELAPVNKKLQILEDVTVKVTGYQEKGELDIPQGFSVGNALKAAWLDIQQAVDRDGRPALDVCTYPSVANSLLDTVILGLNPAKEQCYYIVHGNKLCLRRSYFGTMALCKRVAKAIDIRAEVVYEGDEFEYNLFPFKEITKHKQSMANIKKDKIVAAYCIIEWGGSLRDSVEIMTMEQIRAAWAMSPIKNKAREDFPDQMAKRTVVNRACKPFINSSSDNDLFLTSFNRADEEIEEEMKEEIEQNANKQMLNIGSSDQDQGDNDVTNVTGGIIDASAVKVEGEDLAVKETQPPGDEEPPF